MTFKISAEAKSEVRNAFEQKRLTLFLGAGVSVPSGLPTWQRLVLAMYLEMLSENNRRAYSNYLHAVADWMLQKTPDPLEITAQKIRMKFGDDGQEFLNSLKRQLYAGFFDLGSGNFHVPQRRQLIKGNATLRAVARVCELGRPSRNVGVEAVITYNYDNLLELAFKQSTRYQVVHGEDAPGERAMPVYHVHGFVPITDEPSSNSDEIIFTEEQYHVVTNSAYSWSNLVQIRGMSGSVGLMIGLSLSDRNVRRLLHALRHSPVPARCYAVLQRPTWRQPYDHEEYEVDQMAKELYKKAKSSGSPVPENYGIKGPGWRNQIRRILDRAQDVATNQHELVLRDLGVIPIWYDDHSEVQHILGEIFG